MRRARRNRPVVRLSQEAPGGQVCVDVFERPDGTFGFEQYRRDPEDPSGWQGAAGHAAMVYDSFVDTCVAAAEAVPWFQPPTN